MGFEVQVALFLFSVAYQQQQARKLKRQQDKAKGSVFTVKNESISLPVVYGRQEIGGVQYDHRNSKNYFYAVPEEGTTTFDSGNDWPLLRSGGVSLTPTWLNSVLGVNAYSGADTGRLSSSKTGTKNEFMFNKHALCYGGIESIRHAKVNENGYSSYKFKKGQRLITYPDGGPSAVLQANGFPNTDVFTNVAYAAEIYRLDRDEQNYSGAPTSKFQVEGMKVHTITESVGVYTVSPTKTYSNNPAYVLMDYLTNATYGRGLTFDNINLKAFYDAAQICDTVVIPNAEVSGHVLGAKPTSAYPTFADFPDPDDWGYEDTILVDDSTGDSYAWKKTGELDNGDVQGSFYQVTLPRRDIKLYECNITLDSNTPLRDNIERIMNTMNYAELVWDTDGKYKILLEYPANDAATDALVTSTFNSDNILQDSFTISFPTAVDRYNQVTVNFSNEHEDFKEDTVTWPDRSSAVHNTYLAEDNGQPLETSLSVDVTNPYNALAKAEQTVRSSRSIYNVSFLTNAEGLLVEPGDFISVQLKEVGITTPTVFRVEEIRVNGNFTCEINAYKFDADVLAWNVPDGLAYKNREIFNYSISSPSNLSVSQGGLKVQDVAKLTWDFAQDEDSNSFVYSVYYRVSTDANYTLLGTTSSKTFLLQEIASLNTASTYDFGVRAQSVLGVRSTLTTLLGVAITAGPLQPQSLTVTDDLYLTNNASGVKSRALLMWSPDNSGIRPASYKLEYKLTTDPDFTVFGTTNTNSALINDISTGDYTFKITPYSVYGYGGEMLTQAKIISGLETPPSDPVGFAGNINEGQINLSWTLPTDLDVLYGGAVEIRYHNGTGLSATWDTSSIIVQNLSGNTNNKTVPTLQGTFFLKFKDSSGIYSLNAATFISSFQDSSYNQVETLDEDTVSFSGVKTNCTVESGPSLVLSTGQTEMTYDFSSVVDLGEITDIRVSPYLDAIVANNTTFVSSYTNVSLVSNFAGPAGFASLLVYVSTTQDDPTGSPVWTSYGVLTIGSFRCRALRFRFIGKVNETTTTITVNNLGILLDKRDIIKKGSSTSSTGGDVTVTFPTSFYGGPGGTDSPTIGLQIIGGSQGDEVVISSRDKTGFSYSIFNSAVRVARSVDWQAIGQ